MHGPPEVCAGPRIARPSDCPAPRTGSPARAACLIGGHTAPAPPEARTHAAGLCQPERLRAARRRIASQRTDELSDRSVGNALTDFLTRHHEYRPCARLD